MALFVGIGLRQAKMDDRLNFFKMVNFSSLLNVEIFLFLFSILIPFE